MTITFYVGFSVNNQSSMSQVERENTERLKLEKSSDNIPFSHSEVGVSEKNDTWLSFV